MNVSHDDAILGYKSATAALDAAVSHEREARAASLAATTLVIRLDTDQARAAQRVANARAFAAIAATKRASATKQEAYFAMLRAAVG